MCFRPTLYNQKVNKENIKKLISLIIEGSGDNHARDGLKGTPERVANLYEELFSGYKKDINDIVNNSLFNTTLDDMIVVKNIEFSSICEHEMTPFFGMVNLGYIPNKKIIGLSKIPKIKVYYVIYTSIFILYNVIHVTQCRIESAFE